MMGCVFHSWNLQDASKVTVTATLQCAGNRRTAMSKVRTVKGVGWDVSAIGNGAKLADVLELVGIPKLTSITRLGGKHVEFVSTDKYKEENGDPYKTSIPLSQETNPDADVLLAFEMNGECAICSLQDVNTIQPGKVMVSGYAASGGGHGIERVDISIDGGKTWVEASRYRKPGGYIADGFDSNKWAWLLFEAVVDVPHITAIVTKAVDIAGNVQPGSVESIWYLEESSTLPRIEFRHAACTQRF